MRQMKNTKDVKSIDRELLDLELDDTDEPSPSGRQPTGRIVHDERGNAVWKWRGDTSSTDTTTSGVLKYIDPTDLTVEGQRGESSSSSPRTPPKARDAGGGYDPYNQDVARSKPDLPGKGKRGSG
jgi:hypothetical protein